MSWLTKFLGMSKASPIPRDPNNEFFWSDDGVVLPAAGMPVTRERALQLPIVQDCLRVIADPIASLPLVFYRLQDDGQKKPLPKDELARMFATQVNERDTAAHFRGQMQWDMGIYNNAYAEIVLPPLRQVTRGVVRQQIQGLKRIDPERVTVMWADASKTRRVYEVFQDNGGIRVLQEGDMWHLRGWPIDSEGLCGRSHLKMSAEPLSAALALQDYAARFWRNDSRPPGWIEHPSHFKGDNERNAFQRALRRAYGGANRHKVGVLEWGMKWKDAAATNEASQFLETKRQKEVEISRIWNVPPHKVGILDRATFSNIEHQGLEFVHDTMAPHFILWQQAIKRDLISGRGTENIFCEFDVSSLLQGDIKARVDAYFKGRQGGWLSINDIRRAENLPPLDDPRADDPLQPMNTQQSAPAAGNDDEPEAPQEPEGDAEVEAAIPFVSHRALEGRANGHA